MPAEAWTFHLPSTGQSAAAVPWARLREVEVHHVDLGAGYSPADWPDAFALRLLREIVGGAADGAADGAAPERHRPPADHRQPATALPWCPARPARSPRGWPAAADGADLTVSPDGELPTPARWK